MILQKTMQILNFCIATFFIPKVNVFDEPYNYITLIIQKIAAMEKYQTIKKLGEGSFGNVEKAQNIQTKEIVAVKKLKKKYGTWDECLQLSEVKALRKISHPNVIKLKELIRVVNDAYLIFQYIEKDLLKLINQRKQKGMILEEGEIRMITKQIAEALACTHKQGFFHRDLKPENILISQNLSLKIIDFGIAKEIRSIPPFTEYVSTRWYRAPELLFRFPTYSAPVDIFALGCLVAQMYIRKPLFQGNSEMDQISKICSVIGSPNMQNWPEGFKHAAKKGINFPEYSQISLASAIPDCPKDALDFISECLKWDPTRRSTASQLLSHSFLSGIDEKSFTQSSSSISNVYSASKVEKTMSTNAQKQSIIKVRKNPTALQKDDELDELLNSFDTKLKSAKILPNAEEDKDDW